MKTYRPIVVVTVALAMAATAFAEQAAPSSNDVAVQLQAAMHAEHVEGRLPEAIDAYMAVVARATGDPAVAANALLQLGAAYEKLGRPEARSTYERIVRTYADQRKEAAEARARLARLGGMARRRQAGASPRRLLEGHEAGLLDVAADGRLAVGLQRRGYSRFDITVRDLATGHVTVLVPGQTANYGHQPRISEDSRFVAYGWIEGGSYTLRVIGTEPDARPRTLAAVPGATIVPADWAPDGKSLLAVILRYGDAAREQPVSSQLAWIASDSGAMRVVRTFEGWEAGAIPAYSTRVSPDGGWIAVVRQPREGADDHYLYVLDADGERESLLVGSAGVRSLPAWTPDGAHVLYMEGPFDRASLWSVAVRAGQAAAEPTRLMSDLGGITLGMTASGMLLTNRIMAGENLVYVLDRRPAGGSAVRTFSGMAASWSPDGRSVAFTRENGLHLDVIVRDLSSGEERSYRHRDIGPAPPQWLANGSSIVVHVREGSGPPRVPYRVDLETGAFQKLLATDASGLHGPGTVSADGRTIFMARVSDDASGIDAIVGVDAATGAERLVAQLDTRGADGGTNAAMALGPGGKALAIVLFTKRYETGRVLTVNTDGTALQTVVDGVPTGWVADGMVRWSPDGRSIVVVAFDGEKNWRLARVAAEGGAPEPDGLDFQTLAQLLKGRQLYAGNFNGFDISPDGTHIVASTLTTGKVEVWAVDVMELQNAP